MLARVLRSSTSHLAGGAAARRCRPLLRTATVARRSAHTNLFEANDDIDIDSVAYGFMASQALFTGLESGVYEAIAAAGEGGLDLAGLQKACGNAAPRLQTLLTSLVAIKSLRARLTPRRTAPQPQPQRARARALRRTRHGP